MKYIANILTDEPFDNIGLYNVVCDIKDVISGIPTLIIGWEKTKREYPDASIIEWCVADNVYWTYGKYERRDKYELNIKKFQDVAFKKFVESVDYIFYDIMLRGYGGLEPFISSILSETEKTAYVNGDMLYVYYEGSNKVVGVSLRDCDYLNIAIKKKLFSAMYNSKTLNLIKNTDSMAKETRFKIGGRFYLLPYLFSR